MTQKLDLRTKAGRAYKLELKAEAKRVRKQILLSALILGALAGVVLTVTLYRAFNEPKVTPQASPEALKQTIEVKAVETPYCFSPIDCIRDVGEELGVENQDIMTMIRIAKCESGLRPEAKNPNSTATGIFQIIIGTWDGNKCEGERWDFQDNIKCAYKLYQSRGFQPWNASKYCWNK
jgi:hypothetical protein